MAQYGWADCPATIQTPIEDFLNAVRDVLADNLIGIYLHGSLAMNCFNPERSDVDVLVVTEHGMELETKRAVAELILRHSGAPYPIEISFVSQEHIRPWRYPTPFDLHYSEGWRERTGAQIADGTWREWNNETQHDADLAAHFTITLARGLAFVGPPPADVFPPVPPADYLDSIRGDVADAQEYIASHFVYGALNLCRVYAYVRDGLICSKDEGGVWALDVLPARYRPVVRRALKQYRGTGHDMIDPATLANFTRYMGGRIAAYGHNE